MRKIFFILAAIFITFAPYLSAKECSASKACEIFTRDNGDLILSTNAGEINLVKGNNGGASTYDVYVTSRAGKYYFVRESNTNDKSLIIVPLNIVGKKVTFNRVSFLSLDMLASGKQGHDVWSGDEYDFPDSRQITDFSWDLAYAWQRKIKSDDQSAPSIKVPDGFLFAKVGKYDEAGNGKGVRIYIYPQKIGLNPDSVSCFYGCVNNNHEYIGDFRGGVGKYSIEMTVLPQNGHLGGIYQYEGKAGKLYLSGSIIGNDLLLKEYSDQSMTKLTGQFSATMHDSAFIGAWTSQPAAHQLPFFIVPDAI